MREARHRNSLKPFMQYLYDEITANPDKYKVGYKFPGVRELGQNAIASIGAKGTQNKYGEFFAQIHGMEK